MAIFGYVFMKTAEEIVGHMYDNDPLSQWLGIRVDAVGEGTCELSMEVREEMQNGHRTTHGGISFSFADSALAFASNSRGRRAVSIECSISHAKPIHPGDKLKAIAKEIERGNRLGRYSVTVLNQKEDVVAHFKGTVFIKNEEW